MFRRRPVVVRRGGAPLLNAALVGGAGYLAGKSMSQNTARESTQNQQIAELQQQQESTSTPSTYAAPPPMSAQPSPPPASGLAPDTLAQLKQLGDLRASGVLTEQEFEQEKQKILRSSSNR